MKRFQIIVEGDADKKFFEDYYHHIFGEKAPKGSITHPGKDGDTGGYQKLKSEDAIGVMRQNTDMGGINLVIFDADEDTESRRAELLAIKEEFGVEFELFLLPNDNDAGALEDMLENIINPNNQPVMDCWQTYEGELEKVRIPTKTPPTLTIPAKKTKIYASAMNTNCTTMRRHRPTPPPCSSSRAITVTNISRSPKRSPKRG